MPESIFVNAHAASNCSSVEFELKNSINFGTIPESITSCIGGFLSKESNFRTETVPINCCS